jgi:hypothetical protein
MRWVVTVPKEFFWYGLLHVEASTMSFSDKRAGRNSYLSFLTRARLAWWVETVRSAGTVSCCLQSLQKGDQVVSVLLAEVQIKAGVIEVDGVQ